jgi:hypothetical protein
MLCTYPSRGLPTLAWHLIPSVSFFSISFPLESARSDRRIAQGRAARAAAGQARMFPFHSLSLAVDDDGVDGFGRSRSASEKPRKMSSRTTWTMRAMEGSSMVSSMGSRRKWNMRSREEVEMVEEAENEVESTR